MRIGGRHIRTNSAPRVSLRSFNRLRNVIPPTAVRHPEPSSHSQTSSPSWSQSTCWWARATPIAIPCACCRACPCLHATRGLITSFHRFAYELRSIDSRNHSIHVLINSVNLLRCVRPRAGKCAADPRAEQSGTCFSPVHRMSTGPTTRHHDGRRKYNQDSGDPLGRLDAR